MSSVPDPVLPPTWTEVLDTIQQSLDQALAALEQQPPSEEAATTPTPDWQETLNSLRERLTVLEARTEQVARDATDVDAALEGRAAALRAWLDRLAQTAQTLADRAGSAV